MNPKYVILYLSVGVFSGMSPAFVYLIIPTFGPSAPPMTALVSGLCTALIIVATCMGIRKCYLTNKAVDDRDFVARFLALYFPASFKVFLVVMALLVGSLFVSSQGPLLSRLFPRTGRHMPEVNEILRYSHVYLITGVRLRNEHGS